MKYINKIITKTRKKLIFKIENRINGIKIKNDKIKLDLSNEKLSIKIWCIWDRSPKKGFFPLINLNILNRKRSNPGKNSNRNISSANFILS